MLQKVVPLYSILHFLYPSNSAAWTYQAKAKHKAQIFTYNGGQGLTKPHGEQLWAFDADEVCLALIGNGFGQQCLTTPCSKLEIRVEKHC